MWKLLAVVGLALIACGNGDDDKAPNKAQPTASLPGPFDAGTTVRVPAAIAHPEPPGGFHLDSIDDEPRKSEKRSPVRVHPSIHIILRSSPPGAMAAVDGTLIGRTPAFWEGEATGKPRDFTFVLHGHAMARYRFVPVTNGVVHGKLTKLVAAKADYDDPS